MINIRGGRVVLRSVELADVDYMYGVENELDNWPVSGTTSPFSQYLLSRFVESQSDDIFTKREQRLIITTESGVQCGIVDLFEFDPINHRAGVGIIIDKPFQGQGYASDTLNAIAKYGSNQLQLHQLWCGIAANNHKSISLFERNGYTLCGCRKEWLYQDGAYVDELIYQIIL